MAQQFSYNYEWDPIKAHLNLKKHGVSFEQASTVFLDPLALSILDEVHSENEERWILLGITEDSRLLIVIHTIIEITANNALIRIISARKVAPSERKQYEEYTS